MTALQLGFLSPRRLRPVRQTETSECGLACLSMIAGYHGLEVDIVTLRKALPPSARGATLKSLIADADQLGLRSRPMKLPLEEIGSLETPAILHWNANHFVVLERIKGRRALIHNTDGRSRWYSFVELSSHFTGVALELAPAENFHSANLRQRLRLRQLWQRIHGFKRGLLQTLVLSAVMQAFALASPYYLQLAVDAALPASDDQFLAVLALGFALFVVINSAAALLRSFVLLVAGTSIGFGIAANVARRLFRLPIAWFEKREVGDVLSRFQAIAPIQRALAEGAVAALLDGTLAILTFSIMLLYSPALALIALLAFVAYLMVRLASFPYERETRENSIVQTAKEQSALIESIRGITTLRLSGHEALRHALWQGRLADATNANVAFQRVGIWQNTANILIGGLEMVVSVWLAINLVMDGAFTLGMVFAYMAYKAQFLGRAGPLIDQAIAFRMLGLYLERLSDIALADEDISFVSESGPPEQLQGRLELRNVSFRYGRNEPLVLEQLNLVVEAGEHVAITGPSGGGKSTLVKILLGLLEPEDGEILVDGVHLPRFGYRNFYRQIGAVLQDDHLFAGSLADNIALFADDRDEERIRAAARAAEIDEDAMRMPMGYDTLIGDMGSSLSGGQRQRLLLARALYREPRLLLLDEGTSHLDPERERAINARLAGMGITRIVVAHRQETLAAADRVYLLTDKCLKPVQQPRTERPA